MAQFSSLQNECREHAAGGDDTTAAGGSLDGADGRETPEAKEGKGGHDDAAAASAILGLASEPVATSVAAVGVGGRLVGQSKRQRDD